ncbi:MAG: nitrous oxide reductase family maturation protein NosD [Gammaproteobacteria bacterium]|nr:nitrous oxide reductase family maturation protein NosD [Gammaproteobacteria bacterium]MBU1655549.1 nitrous oxide reductase family maturation protein NosD [Gammaproteobacteria bacterium]MBU1960246.1 nitrous oxide reductase family maturation protein NosD [Gammaproteobacteria bacterium]
MKRVVLHFCLLTGLLLPCRGFGHPPLQLYVTLTPSGGVHKPEPGIYSGPVVIDRPMTLDGGGKVTLDGGGNGTVVTIKADGVTLRGLRITHSGESHDQVDAGILLDGANKALIEDNSLDDVLFGVHLKKAYDNVIQANRISSKPNEPTLRGEGVRLWYSSDNLIKGNRIDRVRDLVFANSPDNDIIDNSISDSRVGMEFVFSPGNRVEGNTLDGNATGLMVVYSPDLIIRGNRLRHMRNFTSSALAVKESSQVVIEGNEILHCALGLTANSPIHPENIFYLRDNHFAYNDIALYFYGEKGGHVIQGNRFKENLQQVAVSGPTSALLHDWRGNFWDDYQGFDRNGDGQGDQPHEIHLFADRLWMDRPKARFFRSSPMLEFIDFIERLAPFSKPVLVLRDPAPRMR